jgi:hypothetical protein
VDTFEPLVNLLVVLTALSIAAERVANLLKLRREDLRNKRADDAGETDREYGIAGRTVLVGVILAVLVKADFFEILTNLDSPWTTLGWVQVVEGHWVRTAATANFGTFLYALGGCAITGVGLGFGSQFWHDVLAAVYQVKDAVKRVRANPTAAQPASSAPAGGSRADR